MVQETGSWWAHIGDSRIYLLRDGEVMSRSRDHSHVELLLREGLIVEEEIKDHPMRNFVECCLGGDVPLPGMSITGRKRLSPGDVVMVCTDGLWSGLDEDEIGPGLSADSLESGLQSLGEAAVAATAPYADNTSGAALRWLA